MQDTKPVIKSIVKAIAYAENGGAPDLSNPKAGKTGEMKSIFQFTPDTWKADSKKFFGQEMPLTADNETYVMSQKVEKWLKEGKTVSQMASMHNAGAGEPDAYTGKFSTGRPSIGVNKKYGVRFDVPGYANKVLKYSKEFYKTEIQPQTAQAETQQTDDPLNSVLSTMKQATSKKQITQQDIPKQEGLLGMLTKKFDYAGQ